MSAPISARRGYFLLQVAAARTRTIADDLFTAAGGVTTAQAAALSLIVDAPGCSQRVIATALRQRESAVTAMVRRLVDAGLVERRGSANDRRSWELWPTDAGRAALTRVGPALDALNQRLASAIGDERAGVFLDSLEALADLADSGR